MCLWSKIGRNKNIVSIAILKKLEIGFMRTIWCYKTKVNAKFVCLGRNTENKTLVSKNKIMKSREEQKILGIIIDNKLKFKSC